MVFALILVVFWLGLSQGAAFRTARARRRLNWALIAAGIPILGLVTWQFGPWAGLIALGVGVWCMRNRAGSASRARATKGFGGIDDARLSRESAEPLAAGQGPSGE